MSGFKDTGYLQFYFQKYGILCSISEYVGQLLRISLPVDLKRYRVLVPPTMQALILTHWTAGLEVIKLEYSLKLKIIMIGCLQTRVRKQPIIALYFEFENELKFYNFEARRKVFIIKRQSKEEGKDKEKI